MAHTVTITHTLPDGYIEQVIDSAGTGCAYWAQRLDAGLTLGGREFWTIFWHDGEGEQYRSFLASALVAAIQDIVSPGQTIVSERIADYVRRLDAGDVDDDVADCIIQVAIFGSLVYG
jgi:hypothetical protein